MDISISALPRRDGALSVVEVRPKDCTLSNGDVLLVKWGKLRTLLEMLCQEQAAIEIVRIWTTPDGDELIQLRRAGEPDTSTPTAHSGGSDDAAF